MRELHYFGKLNTSPKKGCKGVDYKLDNSHQKYIRIIVVGGIEKNDIISAMKDLMTHSDYPVKHTLWDMSGAHQGSIDVLDIKEIIGVLRLYRPKQENFAGKSVFLVSGAMNKALLNVYINLSKMLPFSYRVYTDRVKAVEFLTGE